VGERGVAEAVPKRRPRLRDPDLVGEIANASLDRVGRAPVSLASSHGLRLLLPGGRGDGFQYGHARLV
jgi:hypothetical protein